MQGSTVGKSLFVLAVTMGVTGFARTVNVTACTNGIAELSFGQPDGKVYRLALGRGAADAGSDFKAWDTFDVFSDVEATATSMTFAIPEGEHRFGRFFLVDTALPIAKRLTFVESTQTQWIDTEVQARSPVRVLLDLATPEEHGKTTKYEDTTVIGARNGNTRFFPVHRNYIWWQGGTYDPALCQEVGGWIAPGGSSWLYHRERHQYVDSYIGSPKRTLDIRDSSHYDTARDFSSPVDLGISMYLFGANYGGAKQLCRIRLYGCKIWQDGVLRRDYYPAEDANGKAGLYDVVSHTFYKNRGSGADFTKGTELPFEPWLFPAVAETDLVMIREPGALVGKWDFNNYDAATADDAGILQATVGSDGVANGSISVVNTGLGTGDWGVQIPNLSQVRLPLPVGTLADGSWTMKIRFMAPAAGSGTQRSIFKLDGADADGDELFIDQSEKIGFGADDYTLSVTPDVWHTLTVSGGPARWDALLDGTCVASRNVDATTYFNGHGSVIIGADTADSNAVLVFSSVEIWKAGGAGEARLEQFTKDGLTGEWTFPAANPLRAAKGRDLERSCGLFDGTIPETVVTDGVLSGDTGVRLPAYYGYRCYHGLPLNASYSVVVDARVNTSSLASVFNPSTYHTTDSAFFLRVESGKTRAWVSSGTWIDTGVGPSTWARCVLTYTHGGNKTLYVNGRKLDSRAFDRMKVTNDAFWFALDNNLTGRTVEDNPIDIGYAAIYSRVLTDAEVAELHSHPTAHTGPTDAVTPLISPVGVWEREDGLLVSRVDDAPALTVQADGGYALTQSTAPAGMTVVVDVKPSYVQSKSCVIMANADGVATGVYGTAGNLNGCLATTTTPSIFAAGTGDAGTADWGGCTYEPLRRGLEQRVAITWDGQGHVRYYVNGKLLCQQDPTAANASAMPSATMTFLSGFGRTVSRLTVYNDALTPFEVASLGGFEMVPPPPGSVILLR